METSTGRILLVLLFATASVTEAMKYLALPRMGRSGYIAFPRLGRGYLAFPRMGRSQASGSDNGDQTAMDCCLTGLKTEWVPQDGGTTTAQNVCVTGSSCCQGLREVLAQKPDGVFYSMCIPACSSDETATESSKTVVNKLQELLQN